MRLKASPDSKRSEWTSTSGRMTDKVNYLVDIVSMFWKVFMPKKWTKFVKFWGTKQLWKLEDTIQELKMKIEKEKIMLKFTIFFWQKPRWVTSLNGMDLLLLGEKFRLRINKSKIKIMKYDRKEDNKLNIKTEYNIQTHRILLLMKQN